MTLDTVPADPKIGALYQAEGNQNPALPFGAFLAAQRLTNLQERRLP